MRSYTHDDVAVQFEAPGIELIERTSGDGSPGTTDVYTMYGDVAKTIELGTFDINQPVSTYVRETAIVNQGESVAFEGYEFRVPDNGNRTLQIRVASGTKSVTVSSYRSTDDAVNPIINVALNLTTTWQYVYSALPNVNTRGWIQTTHIDSGTQRIKVEMVIGAGYDNNLLAMEKFAD